MMRAYHESEWAVRRWDWFNGGRIVEPLSFCQFWRTVVLYATVQWFFQPVVWLSKTALMRWLFEPRSLPMPPVIGKGFRLAGRGCWASLRALARIFWAVLLPLRLGIGAAGRPALAGAVSTGERLGGFYDDHRNGIDTAATSFLVIALTAGVIFIIVALLIKSWIWTLVGFGLLVAGLGLIIVGGVAIQAFAESAVPGLLWQAAVAAHHGICPPMDIVRESVEDAP